MDDRGDSVLDHERQVSDHSAVCIATDRAHQRAFRDPSGDLLSVVYPFRVVRVPVHLGDKADEDPRIIGRQEFDGDRVGLGGSQVVVACVSHGGILDESGRVQVPSLSA